MGCVGITCRQHAELETHSPTSTQTFLFFTILWKQLSCPFCHTSNDLFFFLRSPSDRVIKSHLCGTREIPQPWPGSRAHVSPNIDSTPSVYFEWSFFSVLLFLLYLSSGLAHWLWAAWSNVLMEVVSVKWACVCAPSPRPFCKLETYIWHMFRGSFSSADFQVGRESSCTDPEGTTWRTGAHMSVRTSRVRPTLLIRSCRNADACLSDLSSHFSVGEFL